MPSKVRMTKWRIAGIVAGGVLVLGAIVGATGIDGGDGDHRSSVSAEDAGGPFRAAQTGGPDSQASSTPGPAPEAGLRVGGGAGFGVGDDAVASGDGGVPLPGEPALAAVVGERIVKTGSLEVELDEGGLDDARHDVLRIVDGLAGFVQASSVSDTRATFTIRVPAEDFEKLLVETRELGEVATEEISGRDVTEEFVDIEARLRHWRAQEAVFLELMTRATTVAETIEVRRELSAIQETIEQLEGRRRFLADRVELSTLTLHLAEPGAPARGDDGEAGTLAKAWDDALDAGEAVLGGTLIVLGALVPLAAIAAVVALLVWVPLRRRRPSTPSPSIPA